MVIHFWIPRTLAFKCFRICERRRLLSANTLQVVSSPAIVSLPQSRDKPLDMKIHPRELDGDASSLLSVYWFFSQCFPLENPVLNVRVALAVVRSPCLLFHCHTRQLFRWRPSKSRLRQSEFEIFKSFFPNFTISFLVVSMKNLWNGSSALEYYRLFCCFLLLATFTSNMISRRPRRRLKSTLGDRSLIWQHANSITMRSACALDACQNSWSLLVTMKTAKNFALEGLRWDQRTGLTTICRTRAAVTLASCSLWRRQSIRITDRNLMSVASPWLIS